MTALMPRWLRFALLLPLLALASPPAHAAILEVGMGKPFALPSDALAKARDGDTVRIDKGTYEDCARIDKNRIILETAGGEVILKGKTCAGKAILVITGTKVTVRGLTLAYARVLDRNGAGIRAEGTELLVENTTFFHNENGLLSMAGPDMSIRVVDSIFIGNGHCQPVCAHGIYVGHIRSLRVERSRFLDQREGHHIKSRANRTEIVGCDIQDGPAGTSSYLIDIPNGGAVLIEKNQLRKGRGTSNRGIAISIGAEGDTNPRGPILIRDNDFVNEQDSFTAFVRNMSATPAQLSGNALAGSARALEGEGSVEKPRQAARRKEPAP